MLLSHKLKKQSSESLQAKLETTENPMGEKKHPGCFFCACGFLSGFFFAQKTCLGDQIIKLGFVNAYLRSCVIYPWKFQGRAFSGRCWDWLPFRHVFGSVSKPSKGRICWRLPSWVEFLIRKGSSWSERITGEEASQALSSSNMFSIFVKSSIGHVDKVHTNPWGFFVKNRFVGGMVSWLVWLWLWILDDPKDVQRLRPKTPNV